MIPSSPVGAAAALGLVAVLILASVAADKTINAKVGDEVTLKPKPGSVTNATKFIIWKVGGDLAAELEDGAILYYRQFEERGKLNSRTGELTIKNVKYEDAQVYKTEIDGTVINHAVHLNVFAPVPVPTIASSCSEDMSTCTLTCEGNTMSSDPVEYSWSSDGTEVSGHLAKTYTVTEDSSFVRQFSCRMKNEVSQESSKPFSNPLKRHPEQDGPKVYTAVVVFVILLVFVTIPAIFHRMKTGEWFFNKNSMPWEADFWRNTKGQQLQTAANGTSSPHPKEGLEEETMMDR